MSKICGHILRSPVLKPQFKRRIPVVMSLVKFRVVSLAEQAVCCRGFRLEISPLAWDVRSYKEFIRNSEDVRRSARCKQMIRSCVC